MGPTGLLAILVMYAPSAIGQGYEPPSAPMGRILTETRDQVCSGVVHIHRVTEAPLNINVLVVDLKVPGIEIKPCLSHGTAAGLETVRSMASRSGAVVAVNGDYWTNFGIPLGLTIVDGEIIIAPKCRTAFGIQWDGTPVIRRSSEGWSWKAKLIAPNGDKRDILLMNSDCDPGGLTLYSDKYGMSSKGNSVSPEAELVLNLEHRVIDVRTDLPGVAIPKGGFVLTGRNDSGKWLKDHFKPGDMAVLDLLSNPPWQGLKESIGAGPRILNAGAFHADPLTDFPVGEEFTIPWKKNHYLNHYPRTAIGISRDRSKVILVVVDGREKKFSVGVYPKQMAELLKEFGAWDGMDLDSGGSSTMVIKDKLVNHPSDYAKPDGSGGHERHVADALLVFYNNPSIHKPAPGTVTQEQLERNIKH